MSIAGGDLVTVGAPFTEHFPGVYPVEYTQGLVCTLDVGSDQGVDFDAAFLTKVGAVPATPVSSAPLTRLEFLRRFTMQQRIALREAAKTDPVLADAMDLLYRAEDIRTDDLDTVAMINYCVALGLLAPGDAANILA